MMEAMRKSGKQLPSSSEKVPRKRNFSQSPHKLTRNGWLPNYHGAWAMVSIPALLGILRFGFAWTQILLITCWIIGYFCFFAITLWLKSHGRRRYLPAVLSYFLPSALMGILLICYEQRILWWIPVYLPLVTISFLASWYRKERSLVNDVATITAATLLLPIVAMLSGANLNSLEVASLTFSLLSYFIGTVFYVKTNIRHRASLKWYLASISFHGIAASVINYIYFLDYVPFSHVLLWLVILMRAVFVPLYGARFGWLSAKQIGIAEFIISFLFLFTLI
ncbi:MAG: YwiC-like family protein [Arcanobacterium sp.]|nr:YwiC-like family protein [Arcanobacterium sp.]